MSEEQPQDELTLLKSKFQQAVNLIKQLKSENDGLRTHNQQLQTELQELHDELDELDQQLHDKDTRIEQLSKSTLNTPPLSIPTTPSQLSNDRRPKNQHSSDNQDDLDNLKKINDNLTDQLLSLSSSHQSLQVSYQELRLKHDSLMLQQSDDHNDQQGDLQTQIASQQAEIATLSGQLSTLQSADLKQKEMIDVLQQEVGYLTNLNEVCEKKAQDQQVLVESTRHDCQELISNYQEQIRDLEGHLEHVSLTNTTAETVATELHQTILEKNALQKKLDLITTLYDKSHIDYQNELTMLQQTNELEQTQLREQFDQVSQRKDSDSASMHEAYETEIHKYQEQLRQKDSSIGELDKVKKNLQTRIVDLEKLCCENDEIIHSLNVTKEHQIQGLSLEFQEKEDALRSRIRQLEHDLVLFQEKLHHSESAAIASSQRTLQNDLQSTKTQTTPISPSDFNKSSTSNKSIIAELEKQAGESREKDLLTVEHNANLRSLFQYISTLRASNQTFQTYIEFLTAQIGQFILVSKRNSVDLDYLKNILLRYIQFETLGLQSERDAMVPVIGQLLQFSYEEMKMVMVPKESTTSNSRWFSGIWPSNQPRSYTSVSEHNLEAEYDPMSAIQANTTSLTAKLRKQQEQTPQTPHSSAIGQLGGADSNSNNTKQIKFELKEGFRDFLKQDATLSTAGVLSNVKDLVPPHVETRVPELIKALGFVE